MNNNNTFLSDILINMYLTDPSGDLLDQSTGVSGEELEEEIEEIELDPLDISGENIEMSTQDVSGSQRDFMNRLLESIDNTIESAVTREVSFLQEPEYKKVLTEEGENKLKKIKFKDSEKKNNSCPILFVEFDEEEEIIELECKHCFNEEAIKKWLKQEKAECPVCRHELKDTREEKIEKPEVSREDIRDDMRISYINNITERLNTIYERETEIQMQQLLLSQYETP